MPPRKKKPDTTPGFNTGSTAGGSLPDRGSGTAPIGTSGGPVASSGGSGAAAPVPNAADAMAAAEEGMMGDRQKQQKIDQMQGEIDQNKAMKDPTTEDQTAEQRWQPRDQTQGGGGLNMAGGPPKPSGAASPYSTAGGWRGAAANTMSRVSNGVPLAAALGPKVGALSMAGRGVKGALAANPYGNLDTLRAGNSSSEGQDLWMGRGNDYQGLYAKRTQKQYATGRGQQRPGMSSHEITETYQQDGPLGAPGGGGRSRGDTVSPGMVGPAQGLSAPGPASDYMHSSRTTGSGGPWFDAHSAATSGLNTAGVEAIRSAPPTN